MIKKYLAGTIAVLLAVVLFAFAAEPLSSEKMPTATFYLKNGGDASIANDYQVGAATCNSGSPVICTIQAADNGSGKPVFQAGTTPVTHPNLYSPTRRSNP